MLGKLHAEISVRCRNRQTASWCRPPNAFVPKTAGIRRWLRRPLVTGRLFVSFAAMRHGILPLALCVFVVARAAAQERPAPPVVIPCVKGNSTMVKFGDGYITRSADGNRYTTTKFGSGWVTRSSDGKTYTTTKFGDGAITRGVGQSVITTPFGSGTISRSSDGTHTTTQRFGDGTINRSSGGSSTTTAKFGSGYISRERSSTAEKSQGTLRVMAAPKAR